MSKLTVRAGRYIYDKETKKVKVSRDKGLITLSRVAIQLIIERR